MYQFLTRICQHAFSWSSSVHCGRMSVSPICQDSSLRRVGLDVTWKEQGSCYRNSQSWAGDEIATTPRVSFDVWNTTSVFPINAKRLLEDTFSSLPTGLNCKQEFSAGSLRGTVNQHNSRYYCDSTVMNKRMWIKILQSKKYFIFSFLVTVFAAVLNNSDFRHHHS